MNFAHWGKVSHSPSPLPSVSTSRIPLLCDEAGVDLLYTAIAVSASATVRRSSGQDLERARDQRIDTPRNICLCVQQLDIGWHAFAFVAHVVG